MVLDLLEDKQLFFATCEVVDDRDTKDVVEVGETFPGVRLGNVGFQKMSLRVIFEGLFQEGSAEVDTGVLD